MSYHGDPRDLDTFNENYAEAMEDVRTESDYYHDHHDFRAAEAEDEIAIREYLTLKSIIADAQEKLDALKPRITDLVISQPDAPKARGFGFEFSVSYRKTYSYSEHVQDLTEQLKATKRYEEAHQIATLTKQQAILTVKPLR